MKKILFSLFLASFFSVSYAQEEEFVFPYKYLKLSEGEVLWEKIFIVDTLNSVEIEKMLLNYLPTISGINNVAKLGDAVVFDLSNVKVDYRKYGGTAMGTAIYLNHPMSAKGFAYCKDGKYRIIIKTISFLVNIPPQVVNSKVSFEDAITKKKATEFSKKEININSGIYVESYIENMFKKRVVKSDW